MPRIIRAILFDLDNTLYRPEVGLQDVGDRRITQWIMRHLRLPREEADALRVRTWREYGTTAKGLQVELGIEPKALYDYAISRIDPRERLSPSPELAAMLSRFAADRHVFTNATDVYARNALAALGVGEFFQEVFGIERNGWVCKPEPGIYDAIVDELALPAGDIAFIEDNPRNLIPAIELGMLTVLLDNDEGEVAADLRIGSILELADALEAAGVVA